MPGRPTGEPGTVISVARMILSGLGRAPDTLGSVVSVSCNGNCLIGIGSHLEPQFPYRSALV